MMADLSQVLVNKNYLGSQLMINVLILFVGTVFFTGKEKSEIQTSGVNETYYFCHTD